MSKSKSAPGWPGAPPRWTTAKKSGVGTARSAASDVWFTIAEGVVTEVFYPRLDRVCVKDLQLLVTDGEGLVDERTGTRTEVSWLADGVPAFRIVNTCRQGRFIIDKTVLTDPDRTVLLQRTRFSAGIPGKQRLYVLLAPHLTNQGRGNNARVGEYKGMPMLFADGDGEALALASSVPWLARSAGYVGTSDGWQDLHIHGRLTWEYEEALDGTVALIGEVDLSSGPDLVLALGFGRTIAEAALRARLSLSRGFEEVSAAYVAGWTQWQASLPAIASNPKSGSAVHRTALAVLATHESKSIRGGTIASLSIPWGPAHGDRDAGGYHVVWPRDTCESVGGLLAGGCRDEVLRALDFFAATQEGAGHWPQNMWIDGSAYWKGLQLDEVAAPVLLLGLAYRYEVVDEVGLRRSWPMVRAALGFLLREGPSTPQDRWEETGGLSVSTLACMVAALLVGADFADQNDERRLARHLRETADVWNEGVDGWLYARGGALAESVGAAGYYVRVVPASRLEHACPARDERVHIPNLPDGNATFPADRIVSPDALLLVRYGLRAANDPRILDTVRVIDASLKVETPYGPCWRRYSHDGYGEHADGAPFDGHGIGRAWPLLVGERAHFELAAGNRSEAERLLEVMTALGGETGLIPEQVWDAAPIPNRDLSPGRGTGSAQPLVWAHAEHLKLLRSLRDGWIFDQPLQPGARYLRGEHRARHAAWRIEAPIASVARGKSLRVEARAPFRLRWSADGWGNVRDAPCEDLGIGLWICDLSTDTVPTGTRFQFTFHWLRDERWEGRDFEVSVGPAIG